MINILISILVILGMALVSFGIFMAYKSLNIRKEYRYKHHIHLSFLIGLIGVISVLYLVFWVGTLFSERIATVFNSLHSTHVFPSFVLSGYMLFKSIYKIYFKIYSKKKADILEENIPPQYYEKNGEIYISPHYSTVAKPCKYTAIVVAALLCIIAGIMYYLKVAEAYNVYLTIEAVFILPMFLFELSYFFDGNLSKEEKETVQKSSTPESRNTTWAEVDKEYTKLWKKQLLTRYNVSKQFEREIIEQKGRTDEVSEHIAKTASEKESNDFLYSRVLSPIMRGENLIIESSLLQSFSEIIVPIVNIMFTASKRMMFICDNTSTVKNCEKWFEELDIKSTTANSNIVIDVLNYDNKDSIKLDSNVDIYIGTVDLALNSKAVFENIDVVFCINVDKIISDSALSLNLLASVLSSDRYDSIQYILFGDRVNGLKQTASQVFMKNDFAYQVVNSTLEDGLSANFWATEKGWLQSAILPGFAAQYLGQLLPLAIPGFKFNINHVDVISSGQSFSDQLLSLQTAQPLLKKYLAKDIVNVDEAITFSENENFIKLKDNSLVVVGDTNNNAALVLLNWLKYAKKNMFLNVVSAPYLLREYIVTNMDFFIGNVEAIGNILPVPKTNIKLSVYRLINQLCYGNVEEETLLREIKNQESDVKIDAFEGDQVRFVTEALQDLTKRAFGANIFFASYLKSERVNKDKSMDSKRYYKLLDSIKYELPERLFKNITFIDSEQCAKVLKKIPVFDLYQNYLEGQYVSFDGKCYLIDKIDYDNGIVELLYASNNNGVRYRQRRDVKNVVHIGLNRELPVLKVRDSIMKKSILCTDLEVDTEGYYEFNNNISLEPGGFAYKKVDASQKGVRRDYKSTNVLAINISSSKINAMSEKDKFKLSFTLSVLLNETFETLFSNIKQYILVRSVVSDNSYMSDFADNELINLYRPIIDSNLENGINIYITEDTELERGITDSIANNFDNIIMKVLFDYLFWIQENDAVVSDKWFMSSNGDYINAETIDKLKFLKYGGEKLNDALDLNLAYECLRSLILNGSDTLTYSRGQVLGHRYEKNPFQKFIDDSKKQADKKANKEKANEPTSNENTVKDATSGKAGAKAETKAGEKVEEKASKTDEKNNPKANENGEKKSLGQKLKGKFKNKEASAGDAKTQAQAEPEKKDAKAAYK